MKDRYAILILVIIQLIVHRLTTSPDFLTINWMIGKFLFSAGIFTILLAIIQQQDLLNNNENGNQIYE